jgi:quinol monooxygenase YgiN
MTKFASSVRFRVKPGKSEAFIEHVNNVPHFDGASFQRVVRTGDRTFLTFTEWESEDKLAAARPVMIAFLDTFRDNLEELSPDLGLTDPVSGPVIIEQ